MSVRSSVSISTTHSMSGRFVRLAVSLALAAGLALAVTTGSPAAAAADCTASRSAVVKASGRLSDIRDRRAAVAERLRADVRRVERLERSIRQHRSVAATRALRAARAEVRIEKGRFAALNERAVPARKKVIAARVAHQLCVSDGAAAETELLDLLDLLGLTPLLDMIGLPQLLNDLGVVELLDMLGLGEILENLGLGSLLGR